MGRALHQALGWVGLAAAVLLFGGLGLVGPAGAAVSMRSTVELDSCTFAASSDEDWNNSANWTCGHVPTTSDSVTVPSGQTAQIGAAAHAGDLTLSGATIQFTANVVLDVTAVASQSNGTMNVTGGTITGAGTITVGGQFSKTTADRLAIEGATLTLGDADPMANTVAAGTLTVDGNVTGTITLTGGVLNGSGTTGGIVNTSGTVGPGTSPETLTIAGDYTQGTDGTLAEAIAGSMPGQFDQVVVSGNVKLDGTLAIQSAGFAPATTDTFPILTGAKSLSGIFATVTGTSVPPNNYVVAYDVSGVMLNVVVTPPSNTTPPSIPSTGHPGDVITCDPGTWTGSPTFTYTWTSDGNAIGGQTASTYTLAAADVGHTIRCQVTAHNAGGDTGPVDSNALTVGIAAPTNQLGPSIPSTGRTGDQITCYPGTWTGSPTFTFAWTRDDTPIAGQAAQTYTLVDADGGHAIRCRVTAHNAGGDAGPVDSNALNASVLAPTNIGAPSIPSTGHTGDKIACNPGTWNGSPTFTFVWTRDGTEISSQTASAYTLVDADAGHAIRCRVVGHNPGGNSDAIDSNALSASIALAQNTVVPSIPNSGQPGDVVTCDPGTWTGSPTFTFVWLRNGIVLPGRTGRTYTLATNDVSQQIRCRVVARNAGGDSPSVDSNPLSVVKSGASTGSCTICILGKTSRTNLTSSGQGSITTRGSIYVNGKVHVSGTGKITATSIGMYPHVSTAHNFSPKPTALAQAVADPFASRAVPSATQACQTIRRSNQSVALHPGVYCGLDRAGSHVRLAPGLYVFTGKVHLGGGGILSGHGVTLFLAHGSLALSSGSTLNVSGPGSGGMKGIAIAFARTNVAALSLTGSAGATVGGAIYGKAANLSIGGSANLTCTATIAVGSLTRTGKSTVLVRPGF